MKSKSIQSSKYMGLFIFSEYIGGEKWNENQFILQNISDYLFFSEYIGEGKMKSKSIHSSKYIGLFFFSEYIGGEKWNQNQIIFLNMSDYLFFLNILGEKN